MSDEDAYEAREKLGSAASCRHESRSGDILRDTHFVYNHFQTRHKKFITDNCEGNKHVYNTYDVEDYPAILYLIHGQ